MDRGTCVQFTIQWYYDRWDHRCRRFHYGGCEGNENRFSTLEECTAACNYSPPSNRDRCFQPHDPGDCDNDIERWFFDMNKKQCVCSWWTGCGGNSNLFYSYNHCMFFCGEYAEHGPGIDEKYWGSRNRSSMSQASLAIFSQSGSTYPAQSQQHSVDRSQSYHQVGQTQPHYPDQSQTYHQVTQTQHQYPDRSQSYQQVSQHQQNYPDRSQTYHQAAQQQQTYQDHSQSYHQTAHPQQNYQDRSQSYHQTAQPQQDYQDRSQTYRQVGHSQQEYQDRSQSYHHAGQSSQDQSQSFGQGGQVSQDRENYPVGDHPYPARSQSYQQDTPYERHNQVRCFALPKYNFQDGKLGTR
ncbi:Kunitz/Bovine pancreatic trypsin inhibitor domain protein [Ancylostoma caninum]|uniref:Kunitz/Bovine pancreatic trypsin inhibitor domain protein n=1 Tax=Ancylostoma caninum TaxID=29170 RepID=A0A368G0B2_ANCCA|nr:Kunitz/Bovine pancreatic trypsin inhibitor domain protein [Ancylostoma caninum]